MSEENASPSDQDSSPTNQAATDSVQKVASSETLLPTVSPPRTPEATAPPTAPPTSIPAVSPAKDRRQRWFTFNRRVGVSDIIGAIALFGTIIGLIYQGRELRTKITDVRQLAERVDSESKKRIEAEQQNEALQLQYLDHESVLTFIAFSQRQTDAIFDLEMDFAAALAMEASIQLPLVSEAERRRIADTISMVAENNRLLANEKLGFEAKLKVELDELKKLIESTPKNPSLNDIVRIGGKINELVGPKLQELAVDYNNKIAGRLKERLKDVDTLDAFMRARLTEYEKRKSQVETPSPTPR